MKYSHPRTGFSLVELSIVLVILGLLVGGILAGQSLIRAAELRSISSEAQRYQTATMAFRDKYFAIPGDMKNATAFWGRLNSNADCVTNSSAAVNATTGVCDGNADGYTTFSTASASASNENLQVWRHLAAAGLIEGSFTGINGTGGADFAGGRNLPSSKLAGAVWWVNSSASDGITAGDTWAYAYAYGNYFAVGGVVSSGWPSTATLKPEEAWNIDTKMDDGMPGRGKVAARYWNNACATSTSNTDYAGLYKLNEPTVQCLLYFVRAY